MKKKVFLAILVVMLSNLLEVRATENSAFLPGGKNYLEEANMIFGDNMFNSDDDILVKPSTEYTFSMPGEGLVGEDIYIELIGNTTYIAGEPVDVPACSFEGDYIVCTFTSTSDETSIQLLVAGNMMNMYYDYYQFNDFQLEEGAIRTSYEEYIAPEGDTTDPEFSGSGAYIKSYQTNELITTIINNHIYAIDDIDGDISNSIIIVSDDYTSNEQIVGEYDVTLSVTDASNNTALFTLTVMVKDEIDPVITGPSGINVSVDSVTDIETQIENYFIITDGYDDDPTFNVTTDDYSLNSNVLGQYSVTFMAVDDSLNSVNKTFIVYVEDSTSPVMTSANVIDSYLSNPLSYDDVIDLLEFSDNYDDLSSVIPTVTTDGFSGNENTPGTYSLSFDVEDNSENSISETITINVVDDVEPVISGISSYTGSYSEQLTVEDFLAMLSVSDNVDDVLLSDIYIVSDDYSLRVNSVGNYVVVFGVVDTNNNETTHQIEINLFDDVAPVIYVDDFIITVDLSVTFTESDALKLLLNSKELEDKEYLVTKLVDEYTGNEQIPGSYIYKLLFTDEDGAEYEKEFIVKVAAANSYDIEDSLLPRNIIVYSSIGVFSIYIVVKKKKKVIE